MPSSSTPIPDERLADGVAALREWGGGWDNDNAEAAVTDVLEAAYPHLLAVFKEQLLGDEAVEAALRAAKDTSYDVTRDRFADNPTGQPTQRDVVKAALEAALSEVVG
jgi:hypothetical protein